MRPKQKDGDRKREGRGTKIAHKTDEAGEKSARGERGRRRRVVPDSPLTESDNDAAGRPQSRHCHAP